jgi:hypothetical protein
VISFTSSHSKASEGSVIGFAHVAAHMRYSRVVAPPCRPRGGDGLAHVLAIRPTIEPSGAR